MRSPAIASICLLLLLASGLEAEDVYWPVPGYFLDLPIGWTPMDEVDPYRRVFSDPLRTAVLQVLAYSPGTFESARAMYERLREQLAADGEGSPFLYRGRDAYFADMSFATASFDARGYFLFLREEERQYALLTFTPVDLYEVNHDLLISALDCFAPDREARKLPGPVSHFDHPYPSDRRSSYVFSADGTRLRLAVDPEQLEALGFLIEREARILLPHEEDFIPAWERYYRMIYRDNFSRLEELARGLSEAWSLDPLHPMEWVRRLLTWIQGFEYFRTGTLSDLTPPAAAAFTQSGDCDSRALLFVILLEHVGLDAVLLVSPEYGHSAAGVQAAGDGGARITYGDREYLFAEVTEQVDIGLVASDMADPAGWIVIDLP